MLALQPFRVPISTLPTIRQLIDGKVSVEQIRRVSIEDLLARAPIGLDETPVRALIEGKCVLVTGAGGSIGSELCRQIASFRPSRLILFERYENSLYTIVHDLQDRSPDVPTEPVIGDVTDEGRLEAVFATYRPSIVLHAAAHKHVPLMEYNCCEAVKNNVVGTQRVAEVAKRHDAERFILISSDKAVNPSSVMGVTKRVAELVVRSMAAGSRTRFSTVRFGNVLGSNGSVVPRFLDQIRAGGPVTVTHPEIRRYFMLIPEAVQLVLHAAALGEGTDLYVLDMGEQIKMVDLAQNLIRLSGFIPDHEIRIEFVGLRPGEKLSEELTASDEVIAPSRVDKVMRVTSNADVTSNLEVRVAALTRCAWRADAAGVVHHLKQIVPSFEPDPGLLERIGVTLESLPASKPLLKAKLKSAAARVEVISEARLESA
jgi:FlaA1/EpsC-like NDP-sugar epimerase